MKLLHKIFGISTLGLIVALPLISQTSVQAGFPQVQEAIAQVAQKQAVQLNLTAAKQLIVVTTGGKKAIKWESLTDQAVVQPGDTLRYTVSSENTGAKPAKDLTITQPVPEQMVYKLDTATSKNEVKVTYSTDNGESFVAKPVIKIKTESGEIIEKPAPAETYTHIRWQFEALAPEAGIMAMYDVEVQ